MKESSRTRRIARRVARGVMLGVSLCIMAPGMPAALRPTAMAAEPGPTSIASDDPETIALGARLFVRNCSPCHGKEAVGEDPASPLGGIKPGLGHIAPALNGTGHTWNHLPDYFFRQIREGTTIANSRMAGWAGRMKDGEIVAVIAFFQSLWPKRIKDAYRERHLRRMDKPAAGGGQPAR